MNSFILRVFMLSPSLLSLFIVLSIIFWYVSMFCMLLLYASVGSHPSYRSFGSMSVRMRMVEISLSMIWSPLMPQAFASLSGGSSAFSNSGFMSLSSPCLASSNLSGYFCCAASHISFMSFSFRWWFTYANIWFSSVLSSMFMPLVSWSSSVILDFSVVMFRCLSSCWGEMFAVCGDLLVGLSMFSNADIQMCGSWMSVFFRCWWVRFGSLGVSVVGFMLPAMVDAIPFFRKVRLVSVCSP